MSIRKSEELLAGTRQLDCARSLGLLLGLQRSQVSVRGEHRPLVNFDTASCSAEADQLDLTQCVMGMRSESQGCILADDMGLGKTIQAVTLIWTLMSKP